MLNNYFIIIFYIENIFYSLLNFFPPQKVAKSASKNTNFIFIYEVKNAISYDRQIENINLLLQT